MGLFQKAIETYNEMKSIIGIEEEGRKEPLAPIAHICAHPAIEISIDCDGNFVKAEKLPEGKKIIIPATEESAGRTSKIAPHPLCDQLCYISSIDPSKKEKYIAYIAQLSEWYENCGNPKLKAVLKYVSENTLLKDLESADLLDFDERGGIKNSKDLVCWRILGLDGKDSAVWTDKDLHVDFKNYYLQKLSSAGTVKKALSMISGDVEAIAKQHLKGVVSSEGNAKIISSNDEHNFTYRGRFVDSDEALTIGYEDSQMAHNALKWLIANQGVSFGTGRWLVCWNPQGEKVPEPYMPLLQFKEEKIEPSDYKDVLAKAIAGYKSTLPSGKGVVIAAFKAATSGRLAITYYNELQGSDFLERLKHWDETCCWSDSVKGVSSPSLIDIIKYAFGIERGKDAHIEVDKKILSQHIQRLIVCRVEKTAFPFDIMNTLVHKTYYLERYSIHNRGQLLFTACCVVRKYKYDKYKEIWEMTLNPEKRDRSYQFGRLLAVLEKIERDTFNQDEQRETNAIRMQSVFVQRPGEVSEKLITHLKNAYYPRLKMGQRIKYEQLLGQIFQMLSEESEEAYNKPLGETYVLGYYLQKNNLYQKNEEKLNEQT